MDGDRALSHVLFPLQQDAEGWPPVGAERVWALTLGSDRYRIDNAPWFVRNLAVGDVVAAKPAAAEQHPTFEQLISTSDHLTIRIICFRAGPLRGSLQEVLDRFVPLGVYAEGLPQYGMVALDVPPQADKRAVHDELVRGASDGSWEWEEGRINDEWQRAKVAPEKRRRPRWRGRG